MILGWYYPDSVGGTENYVRLLANDLKSLGCDSLILAPSNDESEKHYEYEGIPVYRYPVSRNPSLSEIRGEVCPEYFEYYADKVKDINPDIVHIHSYTRACSVYHAEFVKNLGIPIVLTVHVPDFICARGTLMKWGTTVCSGEMIEEECTACVSQMHGLPQTLAHSLNYIPDLIADKALNMENKLGTALSMKRIISTRIKNTEKLFELSDRIVSVCNWLENMLLINKVNPSKIYVSTHGISTELIDRENSEELDNNILRIGFIGRFKPVKGIHILIEAIKKLPPSTSVELSVYGRADTVEEKAYLKDLKLISENEDRIKFRGTVNNENRSEVFKSFHILAIPSIWLETGPYVLLEAFSEGIPIIGSDLGGISEHVVDGVNGILVNPDDIKEWSKSIKYLSENQELIQDFKSGLPSVKKSIDVAKEMVSVYETVLA